MKNLCTREKQSGRRTEMGRACPAVTRASGVAKHGRWRRTYDPFACKMARSACLLIKADLPSRLSGAKSSRGTGANRKIWLLESAPIYRPKWIAITALQHARSCGANSNCPLQESRITFAPCFWPSIVPMRTAPIQSRIGGLYFSNGQNRRSGKDRRPACPEPRRRERTK